MHSDQAFASVCQLTSKKYETTLLKLNFVISAVSEVNYV